jgi:hypothetical protein
MLTRFHKIMIALLAVQVALAVIVRTRGDDAAPLQEHPLLAGFDAAQVSRIQIAGKDGKPVDLAKKGDHWVIASGFDYPVPDSKVSELLAPVAKLAAASPIATSTTRHKQLGVADGDFTRKLTLTINGKDTTFFIGTPVGMRRSALRFANDPKVYAVPSIWTSADPHDWMDAKYVDIPKDDVAKLTIDKAGTQLVIDPGDAKLDANQVSTVVGNAASIEALAPGDPKRDASHPLATLTIERKAKDQTSQAPVVLDVLADGDHYWVKQRGLDRAVTVTKNALQPVLDATADSLAKKQPPATATNPQPAKKSG